MKKNEILNLNLNKQKVKHKPIFANLLLGLSQIVKCKFYLNFLLETKQKKWYITS